MHTITLVPNICKPSTVKEDGKPDFEKPADYSGEIVLRAPTYAERQDFYDLEEAIEKFDVDKLRQATKEELEAETAKMSKLHYFTMKRKVIKAIPGFIVSVNIVRVEDSYAMTYDDLNHDSECGSVIEEIATKIIGKFRVGKNSPTN